jgi:hypothetical protein
MARPLRHPVSRYRPDPPPDLAERAERDRLSAPALKAFFNLMAEWKIRDEARRHTGGVTTARSTR